MGRPITGIKRPAPVIGECSWRNTVPPPFVPIRGTRAARRSAPAEGWRLAEHGALDPDGRQVADQHVRGRVGPEPDDVERVDEAAAKDECDGARRWLRQDYGYAQSDWTRTRGVDCTAYIAGVGCVAGLTISPGLHAPLRASTPIFVSRSSAASIRPMRRALRATGVECCRAVLKD